MEAEKLDKSLWRLVDGALGGGFGFDRRTEPFEGPGDFPMLVFVIS